MTYLYKKNLEKVSLYIGIFSLILVFLGFSIPLGALGIVMSLLSRGSGTMSSNAKIALGLSTAAFVIGVLMYVWSYYLIFTGALGDIDQILELYQQLQG